MTNEYHQWRCPSCGNALSLELNEHGKTWLCANRHGFDVAKEGYVNLLLAHKRNSKAPGDSKDMVVARRNFLNEGHYAPLVEAMAEQLSTYFSKDIINLFDAGCGEGYYLQHLIEKLTQDGLSSHASGIDISKPAVQKAAKRIKTGQFAVASTYEVPLLDNSQDAVVQVFAPSSSDEIYRVLAHNGIWLLVSPAKKHLFELKQAVYDRPQLHQILHEIPSGFTLHSTQQVTFSLALHTETSRHALLMMTPFYWQISEQKKDALLASLNEVTADFDIRVM